MINKNNPELIPRARALRKNMTKEERHLWYDFLRDYPVRFRRQEIFNHYIADFYCASAKLVIELDGSQHFEKEALAYDEQRSQYLGSFGICVIRIANNDVMKNFKTVCQYIDNIVKTRLKE